MQIRCIALEQCGQHFQRATVRHDNTILTIRANRLVSLMHTVKEFLSTLSARRREAQRCGSPPVKFRSRHRIPGNALPCAEIKLLKAWIDSR